MKKLFVNVKTGPETLMKIVALARRKGIEIRNLSMTELEHEEFSLEINYVESCKNNFISLVSDFEDVVVNG